MVYPRELLLFPAIFAGDPKPCYHAKIKTYEIAQSSHHRPCHQLPLLPLHSPPARNCSLLRDADLRPTTIHGLSRIRRSETAPAIALGRLFRHDCHDCLRPEKKDRGSALQGLVSDGCLQILRASGKGGTTPTSALRGVYRYLCAGNFVSQRELGSKASGERLEKSNVRGTGICVMLLDSLSKLEVPTHCQG